MQQFLMSVLLMDTNGTLLDYFKSFGTQTQNNKGLDVKDQPVGHLCHRHGWFF